MGAIKRKMLEGDTIEKGRKQAKQLVQHAIAGLVILPDTSAKAELIHLANLVASREY